MAKHVVITLLNVLAFNIVFSQILWNSEADSLDLSPKNFDTHGTIMMGSAVLSGDVIINFEKKEIFFRDKNALYRLEGSDIKGITLEGYGTFDSNFLFSNNIREQITKLYRARLFSKLKLNEIKFSLSRNTRYFIKDGAITIENQKDLLGKIISIQPNAIRLIESGGEIKSLFDNDFNYLVFQNKRYFSCSSLYKEFYADYDIELVKIMVGWKDRINSLNLESLLREMGSMDNSQELADGKRLLTWENDITEISSSSYTNISQINFGSTTHTTGAYSATFRYIPKLFLYNYRAYSSGTSSIDSQSYTNSTTHSSASTLSSSFSKVIKIKFSVLIDNHDKILSSFQKNIFNYPQYGEEFIFSRF